MNATNLKTAVDSGDIWAGDYVLEITAGSKAFEYKLKITDAVAVVPYTVKYLEQGTGVEVAPTKTVKNQKAGSTIYESSIYVEGYTHAAEPNTKSLVLDKYNQEIRFYYTINSYTVTFDADGGSSTPTPIETNYNTVLDTKLPTAPAKDGYKFDGWFAADGSEFTAATPVTKNITVKAKWTSTTESEKVLDDGGAKVLNTVKSVGTAVKTIYVQKGKTVKIPYVVYANAGYSGKKADVNWSVNKANIVKVASAKASAKKATIKNIKFDGKSLLKVKAGSKTATVKLTLKSGTKTLKLKIKVLKSKKAVKNFTAKAAKTLRVGASKVIKITKITKNATGNVAKFSIPVNYERYLTVDAAGKLTALKTYKNGKKAISIKVKVGKVTKTIKVKVKK